MVSAAKFNTQNFSPVVGQSKLSKKSLLLAGLVLTNSFHKSHAISNFSSIRSSTNNAKNLSRNLVESDPSFEDTSCTMGEEKFAGEKSLLDYATMPLRGMLAYDSALTSKSTVDPITQEEEPEQCYMNGSTAELVARKLEEVGNAKGFAEFVTTLFSLFITAAQDPKLLQTTLDTATTFVTNLAKDKEFMATLNIFVVDLLANPKVNETLSNLVPKALWKSIPAILVIGFLLTIVMTVAFNLTMAAMNYFTWGKAVVKQAVPSHVGHDALKQGLGLAGKATQDTASAVRNAAEARRAALQAQTEPV
ncbi:MAG: hypothetical protein V4629_10450 [Pseudomonadota bacterium]